MGSINGTSDFQPSMMDYATQCTHSRAREAVKTATNDIKSNRPQKRPRCFEVYIAKRSHVSLGDLVLDSIY